MKDLKRVFFWKGLRISAILVKALSLLRAFLQICFSCLLSLISLSIITPKISFTEVFFSLKFLYTKISCSDRFDPKDMFFYCTYFDMHKLWKITFSVIIFLVWMFVREHMVSVVVWASIILFLLRRVKNIKRWVSYEHSSLKYFKLYIQKHC